MPQPEHLELRLTNPQGKQHELLLTAPQSEPHRLPRTALPPRRKQEPAPAPEPKQKQKLLSEVALFHLLVLLAGDVGVLAVVALVRGWMHTLAVAYALAVQAGVLVGVYFCVVCGVLASC